MAMIHVNDIINMAAMVYGNDTWESQTYIGFARENDP